MYLDLYEHYLIKEYGLRKFLPSSLWFLASVIFGVCLHIAVWPNSPLYGKICAIIWVTLNGQDAFEKWSILSRKLREYGACTENEDGNLVLNPRTTKKGNLCADLMIYYLPAPDNADVLVLEDIKIKGSTLTAKRCIHLRPNRKPEIIKNYEQKLQKAKK